MKRLLIVLISVFSSILLIANENKITQYVLDNGLTVILNEDHSQPTVFGCVVVRAGSKDDPTDATGLAHYMEHVMFKGTQQMGTSNWEAEKQHYETIVDLYEKMRLTESPEEKAAINKQINEESVAEAQYVIPNEFSNLVQAIGGVSLNAATGKDFTYYHNSFPPFQIERWLDLYSSRFVDPVYRGFQAELENVYEEKNMYSDNPYRVVYEDFTKYLFEGDNPYGRSIIGYTDHLKNPSIKRITEFYNAFYVPSNMALVLSGDIDPSVVKPLIENTFGKWEKRAQEGVSKKPTNVTFSKPTKVKVKLTPNPILILGYPAVPTNDPDELVFDFCTRLLTNSSRTGLLDKLVIEGDLLQAYANYESYKYAGSVMIQLVPVFDMSQFKFEPLASVEKMVIKEIDKIKNGEFENWLIDAFKNEMKNDYDMLFESPVNMGNVLMQLYANNTDLDKFENYKDLVDKISKEDIIRVANTYFTDNHLTYISDIGEPDKDNIKKPDYKTVDPVAGLKSEYSGHFEQIPLLSVHENFVDFSKDIQTDNLADKVKLYYTPNPKNDIFSLTIKFGVGTGKLANLDIATQLMNNAGIMVQFKPQELKKEYAKLGCKVNFSVSESYLFIKLEGNEANLGSACQLLSRTFLLPALDEKQMNNAIGGVLNSRRTEKKDKSSQSIALLDYTMYGDNSPEIDRTLSSDLQALSISNLTGEFIKATQYEASVHYVGKLSFAKVKETLTNNLALPSNMKTSESPYIRPMVADNKETILFYNNSDARQSEIYLFQVGDTYQLDDEAVIDAYNQYFSGGFNGLVLQELREKSSFAYTAYAIYDTPALAGKNTRLIGYIGTQSDKTADAVTEFMKLIKEMPLKPERMDNVKNYLVQSSQATRPGFRYLSQNIESWKKMGYTDDPNKLLIPEYNKLSFDDINKFYQEEIANKPVTIVIVGNKKDIDMDKLGEVAKIVKVNNNKIFKD